MNFKLLAMALISLTVLSTYNIIAQDSESETDRPGLKSNAIYLGPVLGYNRSFHTTSLASFQEDVNKCPVFENGVANGFHAGFFYEQPFSAVSKHSIIVRALYNVCPASFTLEGDKYPSLVDDGTGKYKVIDSKTRHSLDITYNTLSFDIMYKFKAFSQFVVTVGPTFDLPMTKHLIQKYQIVEPLNAQFVRPDDWQTRGYRYEDNDRTIVVQDKDIEGASALRAGVKFGAQFEILTGKKIDIIPGVFYNYAITKVTDKDDWRVNILQVGVDIRFAVPNPF